MTATISRVVQYSKLESNECVDEENGIECGVISPQDGTGHFTIDDTSRGDDDDQQIEIDSASESVKRGERLGLDASISHLQGRPDLESIIKTAFESARDEETDIGVFMCGPSSLTTAVSRAIRHEEKRERCVANPLSLSHEPRAYVYQEMFEL
mmetsp:Transcript_21084/g.42177  ORF Transcript_21084/g.42177 Transcript_21084/m.42177 type:complete len:153 (+) Transcript_21084:2127-2585(+)